jgi:hypothetical protein
VQEMQEDQIRLTIKYLLVEVEAVLLAVVEEAEASENQKLQQHQVVGQLLQ